MLQEKKYELREESFQVEHEGMVLRGEWLIREDLARAPLLLILHGIPRAKPLPGDSSYRELASGFARLGFLAVIFNFRGAGLSGGDLSMFGWSSDLRRVLAFARGLPLAEPNRVALLGFSAGAAAAIHTAAHDLGVSAVVSAGCPADFRALQQALPTRDWLSLFRQIGLIRSPEFPGSVPEWEAEFDLISPLSWVHLLAPRPLLILHGEKDELIPPDHARRIFEKAAEPKELVFVKDGRHRLRTDPAAIALAEKWLVRWKVKEEG